MSAQHSPNTAVKGRHWLMPVLITVLGYAADQGSKWWVLDNLHEGESIPVIPGLLSWQFVRNPGAAFSMGTEYTWVFTLIMVVVGGYVIYRLSKATNLWWRIFLAALLGGVLGNLTDRIFQQPSIGLGHVIDFIAVRNFAVFNIADSLIVCSMIVLCLLMIKGVESEESLPPSEADSAAEDAAEEHSTVDDAAEDTYVADDEAEAVPADDEATTVETSEEQS